ATNMYGMPTDTVAKVIADYVEAKSIKNPTIENYEQWLVASYGRTYAELFPMQYTRKYHTTDAKNLTTEWVGPRLYQAKLEEILRGALAPAAANIHYVQDYRYPTHGGFAAFLADLVSESQVQLNHEVVGVNPKARELTFGNGSRRNYSQLVSSVALPD